MWKLSLPTELIMCLLAVIRAASRDSEEICSFSRERRWTQAGKVSTGSFFFPTSKILIFASGTPRQYRDLMYGLFLM